MKLEQIVTSQKLSKQLKDAGVPQEDSLFKWYGNKLYLEDNGFFQDVVNEQLCSAFTASELGKLLPLFVYSFCRNYEEWVCMLDTEDQNDEIQKLAIETDDSFEFVAKTEAEARGLMLLYLINFEGEK